MHAEVIRALRCPVCGDPLALADRVLRCPRRHSIDLARQGHANLIAGRPPRVHGDTAAMIAARADFLAGGHFAPLAAALADLAGAHAGHAAPDGLVVEVGAGTAYYLAAVLDALPGRAGLAIDLSPHAARRAARAHERASAIVADVSRLPLADASAALVLDVFAPRPAAELARVLHPRGALLVVTPTAAHLAELAVPLGLVAVDPHKQARLDRTLGAAFTRAGSRTLTWPLQLDRTAAASLLAMGPSAHHVPPEQRTARLATLPDPAPATAEVRIDVLRPRPQGAGQPLSAP